MTQEEICSILFPSIKSSPVYQKFGNVKFRIPEDGEVVETWVDGNLETTNTASNSVAIIGPKGEEYLIGKEKFDARYEIVGDGVAKASGKINAIKVTNDNFIQSFTASWGETMYVTVGGWYACTLDDASVYFIDEGVFDQTYKLSPC